MTTGIALPVQYEMLRKVIRTIQDAIPRASAIPLDIDPTDWRRVSAAVIRTLLKLGSSRTLTTVNPYAPVFPRQDKHKADWQVLQPF